MNAIPISKREIRLIEKKKEKLRMELLQKFGIKVKLIKTQFV
jgi:hypothetical protein